MHILRGISGCTDRDRHPVAHRCAAGKCKVNPAFERKCILTSSGFFFSFLSYFLGEKNRTWLYCFYTHSKLVIYGKNKQQHFYFIFNQLLLYHEKIFTSWQLHTFLADLLVVGDDAVKHSELKTLIFKNPKPPKLLISKHLLPMEKNNKTNEQYKLIRLQCLVASNSFQNFHFNNTDSSFHCLTIHFLSISAIFEAETA